jgi:hypothetical protein
MTIPVPAATYERARRLANYWLFTVDLQCRRLKSSEPEDEQFVLRRWADFEFLVVALTRFRRAVALAAGLPELQPVLSIGLQVFDGELPSLKRLRDTAEHFDDYAVDRGRDIRIKRQSLEVSTLSGDGTVLVWLGEELDSDHALSAAARLFATLQNAARQFESANQ